MVDIAAILRRSTGPTRDSEAETSASVRTFGYRYVRKNEHADARYEVVAHEAAVVAELFRRYVEDGVAIADLTRWLTTTGVGGTRTGNSRWTSGKSDGHW